MNTKERTDYSVSNDRIMNYVLQKRRKGQPNTDTIPFRSAGLINDGHISPASVPIESNLVYSEITHDSTRQSLRPQNRGKIKALPKKNVTKESKLQQSIVFKNDKSTLMDHMLTNQRYQMSNFYPQQLTNYNSPNGKSIVFGSLRGGVSTRSNKDTFSEK